MTHCRNCDAVLLGEYCHKCGQSADNYHRNVFFLFWDIIKELFNFDSRMWRTLPILFFMPGRLVRAQISGKIRQHIPPFRLFAISLVILIFSFQFKINEVIDAAQPSKVKVSSEITKPNSNSEANYGDIDIGNEIGNEAIAMDFRPIASDFKKFMNEGNPKLAGEIAQSNTDVIWLRDALANAVLNPKVYLLSLFEWTQKLSVLLLPITTLFLGLMYFWRRDLYLFDHALVALSMISFVFLTISICLWLPPPWGGFLYFGSYLLIPINFYYVFRHGYQSSRIGSLIRMTLTSFGIFLVFIILILSVMALAGIA